MDGPVVVLDNGACKCRLGIAGEAAPRATFQNAAAKAKGDSRLMLGMEIDNSKSVNQLNVRRPFDRGYLVNWDLEYGIWARMLDNFVSDVRLESSSLLMTEPLFNLPSIQRVTQEVVFEQFGFQSMHAAPAPEFAMHKWAADHPADPVAQSLSGVVLDAGFSFTHAVPIFDGQVQRAAVKRLRLGGKLLSNLMKEWVSYRSMNLKDEPYLVELVKDQVCYVALDVAAEMRRCFPKRKSEVVLEYVLPDGVKNICGYVRDPRDPEVIEAAKAEAAAGGGREAVLTVNNERFMVPEALFNPSDIGVDQAGVAETLAQAVTACHPVLQPLLTQNVLLIGGTSGCPGFKARVERDLRPFVDGFHDLVVNQTAAPALMAWQGASLCGAAGYYRGVAVTKAEYDEHGVHRTVPASAHAPPL